MITVFLHTLARSRGAILGWGISLALLGMYLMTFYDTLAEQQETIMQLISSYPPELMAFFGDMSALTMFTPEGYLGFEFFSFMPLVLGVFAVLAGSSLLVADEENGTLDLVLAYPISRTALFMGRLLGLVAALAAILALTWSGLMIGRNWSSIELSGTELARPFLSLAAVLLFFGALALLLSMLLPSRNLAAMATGLILVASYFVTSLARIDDSLEKIARFSPLNYYQGGNAVVDLNGQWLLGLLGVAALFALLAAWRFQRRDIRVAGEGSWQWPLLWGKPAARPLR
ncbi:MAG: ABC transporter permease subunit [Chloroflexi bacterium]|nr:ABC transporter permease subunit [Chloroflexota bacterium]